MAKTNKPIPKPQVELSQELITPYLNQGKVPITDPKKREYQRSVKQDDVKMFAVGLQDFDQAIVYYFNNVIRPSVIQNGVKINVPFIYGSPEKWASVQRDGYYRDVNGKIQTPLIMFKRDSLEKNRTLGNKLDANLPSNFGVFEKKYSKKNYYDQFSVLTNRIPVKEYYGVIIPDYVNIVYSCTIFTEYVEQMNKIVESINFASDSYWGDPERFKFRADIDSYTNIVEQTQGEDRIVKTSFQIKLAGHIVSDAINTAVARPNKFFAKASVKFGIESAGSADVMNALAASPASQAPNRFFDTALTGVSSRGAATGAGGMTAEEIAFVGLSTTAIADTASGLVATFLNKAFASPPSGFPAIAQDDFRVYVNGQLIDTRLRTVAEAGSNITVTFDAGLGYTIDSQDQVVLSGKFN